MLDDDLFKVEEGAEALGVSRATFFNYVARGILPPPIKIGCLSRWRKSDLEDAIEQMAARRYDNQPKPQPAPNARRRRPAQASTGAAA